VKGIIFNLLEEFVDETLGDAAYEEILETCDLETTDPFVGPGSYPDEDLLALVGKTVERQGTGMPDGLRAFGRFCIPQLALRFPAFLAPHTSAKSFLLSVDDLHTLEVRKLLDDARPPRFDYADPAPDRLVMRYSSSRRLCHLVEGLIEGVAQHFGDPITYRQSSCMERGDGACEFELTFPPREHA
jgi:hypothetical protein